MKITPLGDSALTIHVRDEFESDAEGCLREVRSLLERLRVAAIPGVCETASAFTTVSLFYDPARINAERLTAEIQTLISASHEQSFTAGADRLIEIPVCYEDEFAPDLDEVASHAQLSAADVIAAHTAPIYHVACIGFAPGFPYLTGLAAALATPRRATPRLAVAAGSVAIGGAQTGIYPLTSPGGWNVIGRTPRRLFAIENAPPALLAQGDRVRFRRITRQEFEAFPA